MWLVGHDVKGEHNARDFVHPGFHGGSIQESGAEHVVEGAVAPLVDSVSLGVVRRCEDLLDA